MFFILQLAFRFVVFGGGGGAVATAAVAAADVVHGVY